MLRGKFSTSADESICFFLPSQAPGTGGQSGFGRGPRICPKVELPHALDELYLGGAVTDVRAGKHGGI